MTATLSKHAPKYILEWWFKLQMNQRLPLLDNTEDILTFSCFSFQVLVFSSWFTVNAAQIWAKFPGNWQKKTSRRVQALKSHTSCAWVCFHCTLLHLWGFLKISGVSILKNVHKNEWIEMRLLSRLTRTVRKTEPSTLALYCKRAKCLFPLRMVSFIKNISFGTLHHTTSLWVLKQQNCLSNNHQLWKLGE